MSEYLYVFGYEPDEDRAANEEFGTDWESTGVFRLEADDPRQALEWRRRLSSWYVEKLDGKTKQTWVPENYASWIEESPDAELSEFAERVPLIKVGEFSSHQEIQRLFRD